MNLSILLSLSNNMQQRIVLRSLFMKVVGGPDKDRGIFLGRVDLLTTAESKQIIYLLLVYLVTALVPSDTACLASSPGRRRRTAVWISREVMVDLLL